MSTPSMAGDGAESFVPIFKHSPKCIGGFVLLWGVTLCAHSWILWGMIMADIMQQAQNPLEPILFYCVTVLVLTGVAWLPIWRQCGRAMFVLLAGSTAFLGLIGIFGSLLAFVLFLDYLRTARPFDEWHEELFPHENKNISEELADRLRIASDDTSGNLSPFLDILNFGNQSQKLTMIALITRHFRPAFASILLGAVNAPDNAIRVQAATAVSYVENRYMRQSMALEKQLDVANAKPELLLQAAQHFDEYAYSGLMDDLRAMELRKKALHYFYLYLKHVPNDQKVATAVVRLLIKNKAYQESVAFLESLNDHATHDALIIWYMESLYQLQDYDKLNEVAQRQYTHFTSNMDLPLHIVECVRLWSGEANNG